MQGVYVQLTRGKERTDLYLTVGPEPLGDQDSHGHPRGEPVEPERLLGRVMTRDGSKTLAADTPVLLEVRRWSTKRLREERDQLTALRRECPPDRSRELRLARQRAADLEQARQAAQVEHQAATARLAAVGGSRLRRREAAAARERLTLAEHGLRTTTRQAGRDAWITAAVELDTWRRTHGLDDTGPAQQERGQHTRPERAGRPVDGLRSTPASERPPQDQPRTPKEPRHYGPRWRHAAQERDGEARGTRAAELLGAEPGRCEPGRRRDWQQVRAALERLAAHRERTRHRDHRRPERTPAPHERAER